MGHVFKFPLNKNSSPAQHSVRSKSSIHPKKEQSGAYVISPREDEAFVDLILEWPCFKEFCSRISLPQLFEKYYSDELTLSQDCTLEFMFHMHDPESAFDIGNALYTWGEDDREFFMLSLNMHAELIEKVKQEEL